MISDQPLAKLSDEELVILTLEEKDHYRWLVERYEKKLQRYIARLSGVGREDAEDILQDVFVKAYRNLNDFDSTLKFSSWIYRIAHNETVSHLRRSDSRPKIVDFKADYDFLDTVGKDFDIEGNIDKKILAERVATVLQVIDGKYREVIILKFMEDKDYREIGDILRKPLGSVATLVSRAKQRLKKELTKSGINLI